MAFVRRRRITIINVRKPPQTTINDDLQWLGSSLGLFNLRDKDKSCFRIFIELVKATRRNHALASDELAYKLHLSRGTVVHHLNKLLEAGLVINDHNRYFLRVNNLKELISEVEKDFMRAFDELKEAAEEIDKRLGLEDKQDRTGVE